MKYKRGLALALVLVLFLGLFAGCAPEEEYEYEQESSEVRVTLENTGESAELTLAYSALSGAYEEALEEIIEKYRADFPETSITLAPCASGEEAVAMLRSGGADLVQIEGGQQAPLVEEGLLWNFYPYYKAWREEPVLYSFARRALESMGYEQSYVMPADFRQELLFYRADWAESYNSQQEDKEEKAAFKTWGQICDVPEKLGDKARLALAGKDNLGKYFDSILWSRAGTNAMKSPCAAYFTVKDEDMATFFDTDAGLDTARRFRQVMEEAVVPGCADWNMEEAVAAFVNGEAGMLLADSSYAAELAEALPEGALGIEGPPRTDNNVCVTSIDFWGWGISEKSAYKETAVHFLMYLSGADNNTHIAKVAGTLPLHREAVLMEPSFAEGPRATELRLTKLSSEYRYVCRPDMYVAASERFPELYDQLLREYLSGEKDREEFLGELDAFWMEAYDSQPNTWAVPEEPEESELEGSAPEGQEE